MSLAVCIIVAAVAMFAMIPEPAHRRIVLGVKRSGELGIAIVVLMLKCADSIFIAVINSRARVVVGELTRAALAIAHNMWMRFLCIPHNILLKIVYTYDKLHPVPHVKGASTRGEGGWKVEEPDGSTEPPFDNPQPITTLHCGGMVNGRPCKRFCVSKGGEDMFFCCAAHRRDWNQRNRTEL